MPVDEAPAPLGPDVVGRRVVVRHLVPGETGPSGGPAMTDVLGECVSWADGVVTVRRDDGSLIEVPTAQVVAGKTVPPRAVRLQRLDPEAADRAVLPGWPAVTTAPLGEWLLRTSGGFSNRGSSVLALGDPGLPLGDAVAAVARWYAGHGQRPRAHAHAGSAAAEAFAAAGWTAYEPTWLLVGPLARVADAVGEPAHDVRLDHALDPGWLAVDERVARHGEDARRVVEAGDVAFATVREGEEVVARGRVSVHDGLAAVASLWTREDLRGQGLGRSVLGALLGWSRGRGARTTYLQVVEANPRARRLYESLGYEPHHGYTYLVAPPDED